MPCFGEKQKNYMCKILLLDETELEYTVQKKTHGQDVLDFVFKHLDLIERDYFGLRFVDEQNQTHWLEPLKSVIRQMKHLVPYRLYFSIKFYAVDPCKLHEEITRYQFFLQVKQDILQGRLPVPFETAAELGGYIMQSELGDYDPRRHNPGYVSEFRLVPNQTEELENRIAGAHKTLQDQVSSVAELNFLDRVKWMDMYGVDLHPVLGEDNVEYFLGLTPSGVIILRNKTKVGNYFWPRISKVFFKTRYFMLRVRDKNNDENTYGFELPTKESCKHLWKCSVEQHAFFRLTQVNDNSGTVFTLGSKFRYSGRTEREALAQLQVISRPQPKVQRVSSRSFSRRNSPIFEGKINGDVCSGNELTEIKSKSIVPPQPIIPPSSINRNSQHPVPESPRSVQSSLWDDLRNSKGGLYTSANGSPHSVRSGSTKPSPRFPRHKRYPSGGSESDTNRRKHHSRKSSDNDSDMSSAAGCRIRSHGRSKNSDNNAIRKHKPGRHKSRPSDYELINSEDQWKAVQQQQKENQCNGPRSAVIKDLSVRKSGYVHSGSESEISYRQRKRTRSRTNRSRSRSRSRSPDKKGPPQEIKKHIEYGLIDSSGLSEEQLRDIPYTKVETESKLFKIRYSPVANQRLRTSPKPHSPAERRPANGKASPGSAHTDISSRSQNETDINPNRSGGYTIHTTNLYRPGNDGKSNPSREQERSAMTSQQRNHFWSQNSKNSSLQVVERKISHPSVLQEVQNTNVVQRPPYQPHGIPPIHQKPSMMNTSCSSSTRSQISPLGDGLNVNSGLGRPPFTKKVPLNNPEWSIKENPKLTGPATLIQNSELTHQNTRVAHHEMSTEL